MGDILTQDRDYFAIRYSLGLEDDSDRLVTDAVIDALPHLPAAELEAIRRFPSFWATLVQNDPKDFNLKSLKMGVVAKCCANLCTRLELTIPIRTNLNQFGEVERNKIDWLKKKELFNDDANWFWQYLDQVLNPHNAFPTLDIARGRLYRFDPNFWNEQFGIDSRFVQFGNFTGYTSPNGIAYLA